MRIHAGKRAYLVRASKPVFDDILVFVSRLLLDRWASYSICEARLSARGTTSASYVLTDRKSTVPGPSFFHELGLPLRLRLASSSATTCLTYMSHCLVPKLQIKPQGLFPVRQSPQSLPNPGTVQNRLALVPLYQQKALPRHRRRALLGAAQEANNGQDAFSTKHSASI